MKDILPLIKSHLPDTISKILKTESKISLDKLPPSSSSMGVSYEIEGDVPGKISIFFDEPVAVAKRFLTITIGDPDAATTEESCLEVGNQVLGLLFGSLCSTGAEARLSSTGESLTDNEVQKWIDNSTYLSTLITEGYGNINIYYSLDSEPNSRSEINYKEEEVEEETHSSTKVMIVDDSPVMCAFLKKIFTEMKYNIVAIAADGLEALEKFQEYRPELVTLDIMMPKLKGTDVLKEIIKISPQTTVVMASSIADAKTVMSCLRMGAKRYIVKPYDKEAVISAIEKALIVRKE